MTDFRFHGEVVAANRDPYYFTNWDKALPVSVVAATKEEAASKIIDMMGTAPSGRYWRMRFYKAEGLS